MNRSIRSDVSSYADDARGFANQTLGRMGEKMRDLRVGEKMRDLGYNARDLASRGASSVGGYAEATKIYVSEQPVRSALIAAAVGAVVAGLIIAMRRNSADRRYY